MATTHRKPTNRDAIAECNRSVARRFGVTLRVYKAIKATTQLTGVGAGIYAMHLGADPMTVFAIIGIILGGPEVMELMIANADEEDST